MILSMEVRYSRDGLKLLKVRNAEGHFVVPDHVRAIDEFAFCQCKGLLSIEIPDSVIEIGQWAFKECADLKSIKLSNSVTKIADRSFDGCFRLSSIEIPDSVTEIGDSAFSDCTALASIKIPDSVSRIGKWAFNDCKALTGIKIPSLVTSIEDYAFSNCSGLMSVEIPDSVKSIGESAFFGCSSITSLVIPDSVTDIGSNAFSLTKFESISLPKSIARIDGGVFSNSGLKHIDIPDTVAEIGDCTFWCCSSLESVKITNSVTKIGSLAFEKCRSLKSVDIPDSVKEIGNSAFGDCSELTSIFIPSGVSSIGDTAFGGCVKLTNINVASDNPYYSSVDGVLYNKDKTELICLPSGKKGHYEILDGVTRIGDYAFSQCKELSGIHIPLSVTSIGNVTFADCGLTTLFIPANVSKIGDWTISDCTKLSEICVDPDNQHYSSFAGILYDKEQTKILFVPSGITVLKISERIKNIESFGICENVVSVDIPSNVHNIGECPFFSCKKLERIDVSPENPNYTSEDGVLYNKDKTELIAVPATTKGGFNVQLSVETIKADAFSNCVELTSVKISSDKANIGEDNPFAGCSMLRHIIVSSESPYYTTVDGVLYNKDMSMLICVPASTTGDFVIPSSVKIIGENAFKNCKYLTSVEIPDSVIQIESEAFLGCSRIKAITVPSGVSEIGYDVFSECDNLTEVHFRIQNIENVSLSLFDFCSEFSKCTLFVPIGTKEAYVHIREFSHFKRIVEE